MATHSTKGSDSTLSMTLVSETQKISNLMTDVINKKQPWGHDFGSGNVEVSDMSDQQKAELTEIIVKDFLMSLAKGYHLETTEKTAKETAKAEIKTRYE